MQFDKSKELNMKIIVKISILLLFSTSCSNNNMLINNDIIIVDLDKAEKRDTLFLSTLFKSVRCIPLETTDKSLIGSIDKMLVYKDFFYVLDVRIAKGLFMFDRKGSFVRQIGRIGNGPGEYSRINDFTIDTDNNNILILGERGKILFYDILTGQYAKTVVTEHFRTTIQYFNRMLYADLVEFPTTPSSCLLQSIDLSTGKQIDKYIQADEFNKGSSVLSTSPDAPYFLSTMEPPFLFRHAFMETFIALTPDGVQPFLTVKSKNFVSTSDLEGVDAREGMMALGKKNKIFTLKNYFSKKDMIHFQYVEGMNKSYSVIYNAKTKTSNLYNYTHNDLLFNKGQIFFSSRFFDQSGVYESIPMHFFHVFIRFLNEGRINEEIKDQLTGIDEESNPVIFYYEFK